MGSSSSYKDYDIRERCPDPESSVLLVIDMQNYFSSIAQPILPAVTATIDLFRGASIPIIFTRHCHKSPADHAMLGEWWDGNLVIDGIKESRLLPEIAARVRREGDVVVEKSTYSAFVGTNLAEELAACGAREVVVTGVMTNLCCDTTARDAFVRGFRVFFSADATATSSPTDLHDATLRNMAYGFAYLVDYEKLRKCLSE